eukprot:2724251-Rhodomonas_salina.1
MCIRDSVEVAAGPRKAETVWGRQKPLNTVDARAREPSQSSHGSHVTGSVPEHGSRDRFRLLRVGGAARSWGGSGPNTTA